MQKYFKRKRVNFKIIFDNLIGEKNDFFFANLLTKRDKRDIIYRG